MHSDGAGWDLFGYLCILDSDTGVTAGEAWGICIGGLRRLLGPFRGQRYPASKLSSRCVRYLGTLGMRINTENNADAF